MKVPSSGVAIETTGARVGAHSTALPTLKASALETKASMLAKVGKLTKPSADSKDSCPLPVRQPCPEICHVSYLRVLRGHTASFFERRGTVREFYERRGVCCAEGRNDSSEPHLFRAAPRCNGAGERVAACWRQGGVCPQACGASKYHLHAYMYGSSAAPTRVSFHQESHGRNATS